MDEYFMGIALEEARKAYNKGEVPVGAVLVMDKQVVARAHNLVELHKCASDHAEMLCMKDGAIHLNNWRLLKTILYCTLEPCAMCAGAMLLSRIQTLVWGAPDLRQGAHGSWVNILDCAHPIHRIEVRKGVLAQECAQLMREFFQQRRG